MFYIRQISTNATTIHLHYSFLHFLLVGQEHFIKLIPQYDHMVMIRYEWKSVHVKTELFPGPSCQTSFWIVGIFMLWYLRLLVWHVLVLSVQTADINAYTLLISLTLWNGSRRQSNQKTTRWLWRRHCKKTFCLGFCVSAKYKVTIFSLQETANSLNLGIHTQSSS